MGNIKSIISKFGFGTLIILIGVTLLIMAGSRGQNGLVMVGAATLMICGSLVLLNNSGFIPVKLTMIFVVVTVMGAVLFSWLDYQSVQDKLEFIAEQKVREAEVIKRLMDIRDAEVSYKKVHGVYASTFDELIRHVKEDSMAIVKANGTVPDSISEIKAVELGIVSRDTFLIAVRDTLFPKNFPIDSIRYVPFSDGKEYKLQAGEIEKNKLMVKVFEAFASYDKILNGMNLSEEYIDFNDGLSVGSMVDPHTRGNWE